MTSYMLHTACLLVKSHKGEYGGSMIGGMRTNEMSDAISHHAISKRKGPL